VIAVGSGVVTDDRVVAGGDERDGPLLDDAGGAVE